MNISYPFMPWGKQTILINLARCLKKRLKPNKQYCDHYKALEEIINKGAAEPGSVKPGGETVWYIPH